VDVAPGEAVSDEEFKAQLETLNEELESLNAHRITRILRRVASYLANKPLRVH
jgi:hypothetical protein